MIRDPSDGSVREKPAIGIPMTEATPVSEPGMTGISPAISGLPVGSTKPEELARLERSREFVRDYHAKKHQGATDGQ